VYKTLFRYYQKKKELAMINETVLRRILYVSIALIIIVTIILAFIVIPSVKMDTSPQATPEKAVPAIWVVVIIHLLTVAALIWTIHVNQRAGHINKGLLVASGVALILLALIISDGATAYLGHPGPGLHRAGISMFICVGSNIITSGLVFFTAWYSRRL
jgi:hypothetical protein